MSKAGKPEVAQSASSTAAAAARPHDQEFSPIHHRSLSDIAGGKIEIFDDYVSPHRVEHRAEEDRKFTFVSKESDEGFAHVDVVKPLEFTVEEVNMTLQQHQLQQVRAQLHAERAAPTPKHAASIPLPEDAEFAPSAASASTPRATHVAEAFALHMDDLDVTQQQRALQQVRQSVQAARAIQFSSMPVPQPEELVATLVTNPAPLARIDEHGADEPAAASSVRAAKPTKATSLQAEKMESARLMRMEREALQAEREFQAAQTKMLALEKITQAKKEKSALATERLSHHRAATAAPAAASAGLHIATGSETKKAHHHSRSDVTGNKPIQQQARLAGRKNSAGTPTSAGVSPKTFSPASASPSSKVFSPSAGAVSPHRFSPQAIRAQKEAGSGLFSPKKPSLTAAASSAPKKISPEAIKEAKGGAGQQR